MNATNKSSETLSAQERAALKERAAELKVSARRAGKAEKAAAELNDVIEKIAEMPDSDRVLAERVHKLVLDAAPELAPKLWYGQPAYAKDGKVVCFFRSGLMDKSRYSVFGFNEEAKLDADGGLWATSFAITSELSESAAAELSALVKQAVA